MQNLHNFITAEKRKHNNSNTNIIGTESSHIGPHQTIGALQHN